MPFPDRNQLSYCYSSSWITIGRQIAYKVWAVGLLLMLSACSDGISDSSEFVGSIRSSALEITEPLTPILETTAMASAEAVQECLVNPQQQGLSADMFSVKLAGRTGWCEVKVADPGAGYTVIYPEDWMVTLAGAAGTNLRFDTGDSPTVFIQAIKTDLPLDRMDEATYGYELEEPSPLVASDEIRISKSMQSVGSRQVLVLLTAKEDTTIKRHFLLYEGTVYMFRIDLPTVALQTPTITTLMTRVEDMITLLQSNP